MTPVRVLTDGASSLPPSLAAEYGVTAVPMQLEIAGHQIDERTMSIQDVVDRLDQGVRTSGPSPGAFVEALDGVTEEGAVIITVGSRLSSTYEAACLAARLTTDPSRVRVVDTATAAGAEGLVVLAAAEMARSNAPLEAVEARARGVARRVRLVASVGTLSHLARGGRVPGVVGWAGSQLRIRVLFEFSCGRIRPQRPCRSADKAKDIIFEQWDRSRLNGSPLHVAALHAVEEGPALELLDRIRLRCEPTTSFLGTFSPVMVAHTGPDVIGLAWWWEN